METTHKTKALKVKPKDNEIFINHIVETLEQKTGLTLDQIVKQYNQSKRYKLGLYYFTTTNKAICKALRIPTEAGTRRKRKLEKANLLRVSIDKFNCPYTGAKAHHYTTNPALFESIITQKKK